MTIFDPGTLAYFGLKSSDGGGRHPVLLPEIPLAECSAEKIYQRLDRGEVILGWYCIELPAHPLDNLFVYRKENDLLCRYYITIPDGKEESVLRLEKIWMFTEQKIAELWEWELSHYGHLYYDDDGVVADQRCYVHDVTYEEVHVYLEHEPMFLVGENRFIQRSEQQGMQGE